MSHLLVSFLICLFSLSLHAQPTPDVTPDYMPITVYNQTKSLSADQVFVLIVTNGGPQLLQFTPDHGGRFLGAPIQPTHTPGSAVSFYTSHFSSPLSIFQSLEQDYYTFYIPTDLALPSSLHLQTQEPSNPI